MMTANKYFVIEKSENLVLTRKRQSFESQEVNFAPIHFAEDEEELKEILEEIAEKYDLEIDDEEDREYLDEIIEIYKIDELVEIDDLYDDDEDLE